MLLADLTSEERGQLELAAHAALARTELLAYCTLINPRYETPDHVRLLAGYLEALERYDIKKLMVLMPPQHGKSEICSGMFPSWCLGRGPVRKVILSSYGDTLAETFSIQNRDTIALNPRFAMAFPAVTISPTVRAVNKWALQGQRESLIAAGIGGGITGFGAWLLDIDDPVKDYRQAHSPATCEANYNWYKTVSRTRMTPDGRILIIMTHWSEMDLVGMILNSPEATEFEIVHLPAVSYGKAGEYPEADLRELLQVKGIERVLPDPLGRPRGEPLWSKFNKEFLQQAKDVMLDEFTALYQGLPGAPRGEKFQARFFRPVTKEVLQSWSLKPLLRGRSWDLAWAETERADFTAGLRATLWARDLDMPAPLTPNAPNIMLVLEDLIKWKLEWAEGSERLLEVTAVDGPDYTSYIEAVASQGVGFKTIRADPRMWRHSIIGVRPVGDKEERSKLALRLASLGVVGILRESLDKPSAWEGDFIKAIKVFPHGAHDEEMDVLSQIVNEWAPQIEGYLFKVTRKMREAAEAPKVRAQRQRLWVFRETSDTPAQDELAWRET